MTVPQTQIQQPINPQGALGQLEEIVNKQKQMEMQINQLTKLNGQLREQKDVLLDEVKKFEVFRPLLADTTKTQKVYIKNAIIIHQLKGRLLKAGLGGGENPGKGHILGSAMFDRAVEECIQYGLLHWHEILPRLEISVENS